jgi:Lipase (class 3)
MTSISRKLTNIITLLTIGCSCHAYELKPGFDAQECYELLKVNIQHSDSLYNPNLPSPEVFSRVYRSQVIGLDNRWELWTSKDSMAVVSIRGTTMASESWMENFYAAMLPASGEITLSKDYQFNYQLSDNPRAAVHAGWLIGTAFIGREVVSKIDSLRKVGFMNILITGHSQGGAIATLLTSYLLSEQSSGNLPNDIVFKTYSSAAPKAGNLYYAYSYEEQTQDGWAFNVVNTADWVPEAPFSLQTVNDFNKSNPFVGIDEALNNLPFLKRVAAKNIYKNLSKPSLKANKRFQKYMGKLIGGQIEKKMPGYDQPEYYNSSNYSRVGRQHVLYANADYYKIFPELGVLWNHHRYEAYIYLLTGVLIEMEN